MTGHRMRHSKGGGGVSVSAHMSRGSVYEMIEEEAGGLGSSTNLKVSSAGASADVLVPPFQWVFFPFLLDFKEFRIDKRWFYV